MKYKLLIIAVALGVTGAAVGGGLYLAYPVQVTTLAAMAHNYLLSWSAPPGTTTTELNAAYKAGPAASTVRQDQGLESGQSLRKDAESA